MTWFKVDDRFYDHPKVIRAGVEAIGLWVLAGCWSAGQLTDGFIPSAMVDRLAPRRGGDLAEQLVSVGLWLHDPGRDGWQFHDWDDYQPTATAVRAERAQRAAGAVLGNHQRWHVALGKFDPGCALCRDGSQKRSQERSEERSEERSHTDRRSDIGGSPPDPARPDPTYTPALRAGGRDRGRAHRLPDGFAVTERMRAWAVQHTPDVDVDAAVERFRDYWASVAGARGVKLDWDAALRNWLRKDQDDVAQANGHRPGRVDDTRAMLTRSMQRAQQRDAQDRPGDVEQAAP